MTTEVGPTKMILVPGGRTLVGSEMGLPSEQPTFWADVDPFAMDIHPVTVGQYREFVESTGYRTEAERFGNAGVFDVGAKQWVMVDGASWRTPTGPSASRTPDDHPVTQVSFNDAEAYCSWTGGRLPTEIEWEHAARGATNSRSRYAWGNELVVDDVHMANTWNGTFPIDNSEADGFLATSPVGRFGETELGLTDMGGNVWEWTASWYRPYSERNEPLIPDEASERVQRGGSFLCEPGWCHGYRVSARSHSTPETALFHVGFRCVRDLESDVDDT
ncbi:MAG: formylglycine-generating enzyme family protein [Rhodothermia bacterium]|nr:formylglycine-generating enzyme family protein [Rhodothermia bacterium]